MQIGETGVDERVADVDLANALRRGVPTRQHLVDECAVEPDPAGEVLLRVGGGHRHDVALYLGHLELITTTGSEVSARRRPRTPTAAADQQRPPTPAW